MANDAPAIECDLASCSVLQRLPVGLLAQFIEQLPFQVILKDCDSRYIACNRTLVSLLGRKPQEMIGITDMDLFPAPLAERYRRDDLTVMQQHKTLQLEEPLQLGEQTIWLHTTKFPLYGEQGEVVGVGVFFEEVTDRKNLSSDYQRRTWALEAMSQCNHSLVAAGSESELLYGVCEALVLHDRYRLALVGWAKDDEDRRVELVAAAGPVRDYVKGLQLSWGDVPQGQGPVGRCLRERQIINTPNFVDSSRTLAWHDTVLALGLASVLALPLTRADGTAGVLALYADVPNAFGKEEEALFAELASNLMYGLQARQTQADYAASLLAQTLAARQQEQALCEALGAIAAVLEQRDPYTAGHQTHVAELAELIGKELGLDAERLRVIYLSAIVHDLGKIQVPVEILTKPGRLTSIEFALIKQHPEVGYEILKGIPFPWPIAEIIRQHHEYLDGSGYPQGLKGEQILLESRILTVADIVESMSSDRPYRPALGIDEARTQIAQMRGEKLDPVVVDACLRVLDRGEFEPHLLQLE